MPIEFSISDKRVPSSRIVLDKVISVLLLLLLLLRFLAPTKKSSKEVLHSPLNIFNLFLNIKELNTIMIMTKSRSISTVEGSGRSAPKSLLLHQQKAMDEATNVVTNMRVGTGKKTLV